MIRTEDRWFERTKNLIEVLKDTSSNTVTARFTMRELIELKLILSFIFMA